LAVDPSGPRTCGVTTYWLAHQQRGSHRVLERLGWPDVVFDFHDQDEIGPRMIARIARQTGLRPEDL
jgi:predicted RNA binding protein YcfA (HicA-like mRNA interferase family)